jgi:hypothetical protein
VTTTESSVPKLASNFKGTSDNTAVVKFGWPLATVPVYVIEPAFATLTNPANIAAITADLRNLTANMTTPSNFKNKTSLTNIAR